MDFSMCEKSRETEGKRMKNTYNERVILSLYLCRETGWGVSDTLNILSLYRQGVSLSDKLRFCRQRPLPRRGVNYSKVVIIKRKDNE